MNLIKQNKLTALLRQALQNEAQNVNPPSSEQLWAELQQRPEYINTANKAEQFFLKRGNVRKGRRAFWKKHQYLAAFIAAGFFMVILLGRLLPFMEQNNAPPLEQIAAPETGLADESMEKDNGSNTFTTKNDGEESPKNFSLRSAVKETLPVQPPSQATGTVEKEPGVYDGSTLSKRDVDIAASEEQTNFSGEALYQHTEEQTFKEGKPFYDALQDAQQLIAEEIWQVKFPPDDYYFKEGKIIRTDSSLQVVTQMFAARDGREFSLQQQFAQETAEYSSELKTAAAVQSPAQPIQVGSYPGYLTHPSPGTCTLTWQQEKSLVTLSGQLEEKALYEIIATLEPPPRGLPE